jgi:hypothetical protein
MGHVVVRKVSPKRLPPGTIVDVRVGGRLLHATVLEDLGPLAPGGLHVVRLTAELAPGEASTFDLSIDVADMPLPRKNDR